MRRLTAGLACLIAIAAAIVGWTVIGSVELGASSSLGQAQDSLVAVEDSLRSSTDTANATADALDAAAVSLNSAATVSDSTGQVARDVADVTATLPPVVEELDRSLDQVDQTLDSVETLLDELPFNLGFDRTDLGVGDRSMGDDLDPLLQVLREAETSLDSLATDAARLSPTTRELARELGVVADELRASVEEIDALADEVGATGMALPDGAEREVNLLLVKLLLAALAGAVVIGQLPDLFGWGIERTAFTTPR